MHVHALPARRAEPVHLLVALARALAALVRVAAPGALAVQLDAVAAAGDAVALAGAAAAGALAGDGRRRRGAAAAAAAGAERRHVRVGLGLGLVVLLVVRGELDGGELGGELLVRVGGRVVAGEDLARLAWLDGLGRLDLRRGQSAALGDVGGDAARGALGLLLVARGVLGLLAGGDVERVQLAAGGRLDDMVLCWVVRDVVAVDDVLR